jgi:MoaA/NifB/PqqE/SkfB family radical SAM enzyme
MNTFYDSVGDIQKILFGESDNDFVMARRNVERAESGQPLDFPPQYLMMKITNHCNSNCVYCNHAANKVHIETKDSISTDILLDVIRQAAELGIKAISFSGGEPLVRKDVELLVEETVKQGIVPVLLTNGVLLDRRAENLYEAGLRYFIISIDSLRKDDYERQRGIPYELLVRGLGAVSTLKSRHEEVKVHVTPVITKHNIDQMPEMVKILSEQGIAIQFSPYHHFDKNLKDVLSVTDFTLLENKINTLIEMKKSGYLIANTETFLFHFINFFKNKQFVPPNYHCLSGFASMYIDPFMNIVPCWDGSFAPIGNLLNDTLRDIWFSEQYSQYRRRMYNCQCSGCWFLCTGELSTIIKMR